MLWWRINYTTSIVTRHTRKVWQLEKRRPATSQTRILCMVYTSSRPLLKGRKLKVKLESDVYIWWN